jgi:hypothetical protein
MLSVVVLNVVASVSNLGLTSFFRCTTCGTWDTACGLGRRRYEVLRCRRPRQRRSDVAPVSTASRDRRHHLAEQNNRRYGYNRAENLVKV